MARLSVVFRSYASRMGGSGREPATFLRWCAGIVLLLVPLLAHAAPAHAQGPACQYVLGFKTLHDLDPADVGDCLDNQTFAPSGDAQQHSTKGLLVWRRGDRWSSFTNGFQTWIDGPQGLQERLDTQRFSWEANPDKLPLTPPAGLPDAALADKAIVIQLHAQTLTAYDHGTVALTTPVTTGRQYLATLVGQSAIFRRSSPYLFVSPWPAGSDDWYPPSWVTWALEFRAGGYYLHDAPWEPAGAFGPGSENGPYASHGCVHVPTAAMRTLYGWASNGTTVVITN